MLKKVTDNQTVKEAGFVTVGQQVGGNISAKIQD
jgi:hypothetical protein